jgi:hypothetical protein
MKDAKKGIKGESPNSRDVLLHASMMIQQQQQQLAMMENNNSDTKKDLSIEKQLKFLINGNGLKKQAVKPYHKDDKPTAMERLNRPIIYGKVRGSPYGSCLDDTTRTLQMNGNDTNNSNERTSSHDNDHTETSTEKKIRAKQWQHWRKNNFEPIHVPVEGFDHIYGTDTIQGDDYGAEAAAIAAHNPIGFDEDEQAHDTSKEGREYGSIRTPLDAPIGSLKDKWRVLPHFLQVRSLMRQHIDSFDYFVNTELKEIVQSPSACEIRSDHDPNFYLRFTDCFVGEPCVQDDTFTPTQITPFQCRLRDCTYSAPIYVSVRYTRGRQIIVKNKVRNFNFLFVESIE